MFHSITIDLAGFIVLASTCIAFGACIPAVVMATVTTRQISKYNKMARESRERTAAIEKEGKNEALVS